MLHDRTRALPQVLPERTHVLLHVLTERSCVLPQVLSELAYENPVLNPLYERRPYQFFYGGSAAMMDNKGTVSKYGSACMNNKGTASKAQHRQQEHGLYGSAWTTRAQSVVVVVGQTFRPISSY